MFDLVTGQTVTLTDDGGPGATSYSWQIVSWPPSLASAPNITNASAQVATVAAPTVDGVYIVLLTRVDGATTTTDLRFFAIADEDGHYLPSAGQTGYMANSSVNAQKAGWAGAANATTNFQMDSYLRWLKLHSGRYFGHSTSVAHSSGSPLVTNVTFGTTRSFRDLTLTGAGLYTEDLLTGATDGAVVRYLVSLASTCGGFTLRNGTGGSTILSLSAPATGTTSTYEIEVAYRGSAWIVVSSTFADVKALVKSVFQVLNSGVSSTPLTTPTRIGSCRVNMADYPTGARVTLEVMAEATATKTASISLYNVTDGVYVGSPLTTSALIPTYLSQGVTLTGLKDYELHLSMTSSGGPSDRVTCTLGKLVITWG